MLMRRGSAGRCARVIMIEALLLCASQAGAQEMPAGVDVFGYYFLRGEAAREFRDIDHLHLSTIAMRGGRIVTVPLHGFIRLKQADARDFPLVNPRLAGNRLTFSTGTVNGVSYRFVGRFLRLGNFPVERPEGEVLLAGRLAESRDGKKVIERDVEFTYDAGD